MRYVSYLKRNLILVGDFDACGCRVKIKRGSIRVMRGSMTIIKGHQRNGLHVLDGLNVVCNVAIIVTYTTNLTKMWHLRLGHINHKGLEELCKQVLISRNKISDLDFCESFIFGMSHKVMLTKRRPNSKENLDYIHSDLWVPFKVKIKGGESICYPLLMNYQEQFGYIPLDPRMMPFLAFKKWKAVIQSQMERINKILRTNNALKFYSK